MLGCSAEMPVTVEPVAHAATVSGPSYDADGALVRPRGWRSWVAVGSSLGLVYRPGLDQSGHGPFGNVYVEPSAYAAYQASGEFPEGTMLALAIHGSTEPDTASPIGHGGVFQGKLIALEASVKDSAQFEDGWAYFDFGGGDEFEETAEAQPTDGCFACHAQHASDDNVFVQFYPVLRDGAEDE
jgi:hypothetical protein